MSKFYLNSISKLEHNSCNINGIGVFKGYSTYERYVGCKYGDNSYYVTYANSINVNNSYETYLKSEKFLEQVNTYSEPIERLLHIWSITDLGIYTLESVGSDGVNVNPTVLKNFKKSLLEMDDSLDFDPVYIHSNNDIDTPFPLIVGTKKNITNFYTNNATLFVKLFPLVNVIENDNIYCKNGIIQLYNNNDMMVLYVAKDNIVKMVALTYFSHNNKIIPFS